MHQLNLLLAQQTHPSDTAAILIEPVIGEGGYAAAPPAFLHGLREICDKHGILLIADEVRFPFPLNNTAIGVLVLTVTLLYLD